MSPTLRPADVLHVAPCAAESIAVGDVVVFEQQDGATAVAHRVVAVEAQGVRTRGDANAEQDPLPVAWDRILGRVDYADSGDGVREVHGGMRGRMTAAVVAARAAGARVVSRLFHRPYDLLAASGIFRLLRPVLPEIRAVAFHREDGIELRLFLGTTPIGLLPATRGRWLIRQPFKLILDQGMLDRLVRERDERAPRCAVRRRERKL